MSDTEQPVSEVEGDLESSRIPYEEAADVPEVPATEVPEPETQPST